LEVWKLWWKVGRDIESLSRPGKKNTNKQAKYLFEDTKNADGLYFNTNNNFGYVWLFSIFPQ